MDGNCCGGLPLWHGVYVVGAQLQATVNSLRLTNEESEQQVVAMPSQVVKFSRGGEGWW